MGVNRLFGLLATFEFACFVAPRSAQSLFMSIHFISKSIASFIVYAYMYVLLEHSIDLWDFSVSIEIE